MKKLLLMLFFATAFSVPATACARDLRSIVTERIRSIFPHLVGEIKVSRLCIKYVASEPSEPMQSMTTSIYNTVRFFSNHTSSKRTFSVVIALSKETRQQLTVASEQSRVWKFSGSLVLSGSWSAEVEANVLAARAKTGASFSINVGLGVEHTTSGSSKKESVTGASQTSSFQQTQQIDVDPRKTIVFRFDIERKTSISRYLVGFAVDPACTTVLHNGTKIQDRHIGRIHFSLDTETRKTQILEKTSVTEL